MPCNERVIMPNNFPMDFFCSAFWNASAENVSFLLIQDVRLLDGGKFFFRSKEGVIFGKVPQLLTLMMSVVE